MDKKMIQKFLDNYNFCVIDNDFQNAYGIKNYDEFTKHELARFILVLIGIAKENNIDLESIFL